MGLSLCWVGVEARHRKRLLAALDLEAAGETDDELGADLTLAVTPEGWVVLVAGQGGFDLDEQLIDVSSSCGLAVGGEIVEGVTFSRASALRDGRELWSVRYNADDSGTLQEVGEVPPQFEDIKHGLMDEEASASPDVSYLFDAPADLAASVTGYRPGEDQGLAWIALQRRPPGGRRTARRPRSLRAAMLSDLVPVLHSLGWDAPGRPTSADLDGIHRDVEGVKQTIWFEYASGREVFIIVHFSASTTSDGEFFTMTGQVIAGNAWLPVWKRFTWKRLWALAQPQPSPADPIGAAIARAREDLLTADAYLRSWSPNPRIRIWFILPRGLWPRPVVESGR